METTSILSKIEKVVPGKIIEARPFGGSNVPAIWVEEQALRAVAETLRSDENLRMDWLENFSVAQVGESLVLTWFFRSTMTSTTAVVRITLDLESPDAPASAPSVRDLWATAAAMEDENAELFGIRFHSKDGVPMEISRQFFPSDDSSFPMRKSIQVGGEKA